MNTSWLNSTSAISVSPLPPTCQLMLLGSMPLPSRLRMIQPILVSGVEKLSSRLQTCCSMATIAGTMTATRMGTRGAHDEQNISQAETGSSHSACTTSPSAMMVHRLGSWAGSQKVVNGWTPAMKPYTEAVASRTSWVMMTAARYSSGASRQAVSSLDITVMLSETGSDFQNSMERSLRSS